MPRTSFDLEANVRVNGNDQLDRFGESIRRRTEDLKNLEKYSEQTGNSAMARDIYNAQVAHTQEMMKHYGFDSKGGIESFQKNYRQEEMVQLKERIDVLNDSIGDLSEAIERAKENNDIARMLRLTNTRNNVSEEKNSLETKLNRLFNEEKKDGGSATALGKMFSLKELGNAFQFAGNVAQSGYTYRQDIANGNVVGAERRKGTSIAGNIGNALTSVGTAGLGASVFAGPAAPIVAGISALVAAGGMGTNFLSRLAEGKGQAGDAEAQSYMKNLDPKYSVLRIFRDISGNESENTKAANEIFSKLTAASMGTGLDAATISQLVQEAAKQGVSENRAYEMATSAGKWNQETGANIDTMLRLQGMAERYGLGQDVISTAYGGLKASGMQKAQLDEFLNGLQSVIEDGIANGYLKSTDEVTAQMTMFATLSGKNPLWQGQDGANNIKQMNAGLSAAADMNNTAQVIAMDAARSVVKKYSDPNDKENYLTDKKFKEKFGFDRTNSYHDYEIALKNPIGEVYGAVLSNYRKIAGGNKTAEREWIKQGLGVDISIAAQLQKMTGGDFNTDNYKNVIESGKITPNAKTEQISWSDSMSKISDSLNKIGEGEWLKNIEEINKTVSKYMDKNEKEEKKANRMNEGNKIQEANKQLYEGITPNGESFSELGYKAFSEKAKSLTGYSNNIWVDRFLAKDESLTEYDTKTEKYKERKVQDNEKLDNAALNAFSYMALKNDGVITNDEIVAFRNALNSNRAANKAYTEGNEEAFAKALGQAIKTAFKEALPTEFKVYEGY